MIVLRLTSNADATAQRLTSAAVPCSITPLSASVAPTELIDFPVNVALTEPQLTVMIKAVLGVAVPTVVILRESVPELEPMFAPPEKRAPMYVYADLPVVGTVLISKQGAGGEGAGGGGCGGGLRGGGGLGGGGLGGGGLGGGELGGGGLGGGGLGGGGDGGGGLGGGGDGGGGLGGGGLGGGGLGGGGLGGGGLGGGGEGGGGLGGGGGRGGGGGGLGGGGGGLGKARRSQRHQQRLILRMTVQSKASAGLILCMTAHIHDCVSGLRTGKARRGQGQSGEACRGSTHQVQVVA